MGHDSVFVCVSNEILEWNEHAEKRKLAVYAACTAFVYLGLSELFRPNLNLPF